MRSAKVVGIRGGETVSHGYQSTTRPLAPPLIKLRDLAKSRVHALLKKLFDNADDALFQMADKAGSNGDQALYFDAMRELRLQKKQVATGVIKNIIRSFNELGEYKKETVSHDPELYEMEALSVLENDALEMKVAVEAMVTRLRSACSQSLDDLRERCEHLMPPITLNQAQVPAGPEILVESFAQGVADLDIAIRARLVVLKLYERYVLAEMAQVYTDCNSFLVQQGVLPKIKQHRAQKQAHRKSQARGKSDDVWENASSLDADHNLPLQAENNIPVLTSSVSGVSHSPANLENLRELLHSGDAGSVSDHDLPTLSQVVCSQHELVSALSRMQTDGLLATGELEPGQLVDFKHILDRGLTRNGCTTSYNEMDADVINLVSMLFEFILGDRQLQPTMKALIGRLQIPILKVAIMDRNFFNKGGHPARKLLNEIASAAIGWNEQAEGKTDRLREKIEQTVDTILDEFDDDLLMFESLLEDFISFMDVERRRSQLVEQRTRDSERGKAASELAKKRAIDFLNEALSGLDVHDSVVALLHEGWSKVLVIDYLKSGEDSAEWLKSCRNAEELLWTVSPHQEDFGASVLRESLLQRIPDVMAQLKSGLEAVSFDEFRRKELFHQIEAVHVQVLQNLQLSIEAEAANELDQESIAELLRNTAELETEFQSQHAEISTPEPSTEPASEEKVKTAETEQIAAPEPATVTGKADPLVEVEDGPEIDEYDPFAQQVDRFTVGCWFEFSGDERQERCKLAAIIKATGKYIFVNRSGIKVAENTREELAKELRQGSLNILNDGLLFDRALESIITNLRGNEGED